MSENNSYSKAELEEVKSPTLNLNQNPQIKVSKREFRHMVITSRGFTVVATLLTFGFYYIYYLFCLEQETDHPFVPTKEKRKYPYERPEEADPAYQEAKKINKQLARLASGRRPIPTPQEFLRKETISFSEKTKFFFSMLLASFFQWIEKIVISFSKKERTSDSTEKLVERSVKEWVEQDKKIKAFFNKKIQDLSNDPDAELDLANSLVISLANEKIKPKKDHYLTFVFWITYLWVGFLTLGMFPIYHLIIKKRWGDFRSIKEHKEHSYLREFDNVTDKLIGTRGNIEYSYLLLSRTRLPLNLNFFSNVFRTKVFRSTVIRKNIVTFLMVVTLGLFGVYVLSKSAFDKNKLNIDSDDAQPTDYASKETQCDRFKLFVLDLIRDIKVATKIAARRVVTINNSIKSLLVIEKENDRGVVKFINLLSSELYFWLFAFCSVFIGISFVAIYLSWYPVTFYLSFWFWFFVLVIIGFWGLFIRHINLLFI